MLPSVEKFAQTAANELGIQNGVPTVLYSTTPFCASARAWWMLRIFGVREVYVLDGGLGGWQRAGHAVEDTVVETPCKPCDLQTTRRNELVHSIDEMLQQVSEASTQILDARSTERFYARAKEPREGLRGGHMPGALSVPSLGLISETGCMKSREELQQVFSECGTDLGAGRKPVVTTCGSGVTAAIVALALFELGIEAAVYDGSWSEYGAGADHPIVTE